MELIIFYFDYHGSEEELQEFIKGWKKAAKETEGVEFKGHWIPHTKKFHHAIFYEAESYAKVRKSWRSVGGPRDYTKMSHGEIDLFVKREP